MNPRRRSWSGPLGTAGLLSLCVQMAVAGGMTMHMVDGKLTPRLAKANLLQELALAGLSWLLIFLNRHRQRIPALHQAIMILLPVAMVAAIFVGTL